MFWTGKFGSEYWCGSSNWCALRIAAIVEKVAKANVLIVDDEDKVRALLQRKVSSMGHEVHLAKDAEEAKSVVLFDEIDVTSVNRILPGGEDGLVIVEFIRENRPD